MLNPRLVVVILAAVGAGCDVTVPSTVSGGEPLVGVVTSPRHAGVVARGRVTIDGLHAEAGGAVTIERLDPATRAWVVAGGATAAAEPVADDPTLHGFTAAIALDDAAWPAGGLVHLRVRAGATVLPFFDADQAACLDGQPSWDDRVAACASSAGAISLVDVASVPPASTTRYLDAKGASTPAETDAYYAAIDAPPTLSEFVARHGLDGPATIRLAYYNAGDLGTGREMRCGRSGAGLACYVRNYGVFGTPRAEALALTAAGVEAGDGRGAFATVAMVYRPPATAPDSVAFMVYDAAGQLAREARLDTRGDNPSIPDNCLNCHGNGARLDRTSRQVTDARFLPFDPDALVFLDRPGLRRVDQEASLRALNQLVLGAAAPVQAEVIRGWYHARGDTLAGDADTTFVPPGWSARDAAPTYRQVIAPYCQSCHGSRTGSDLAFGDAASVRQRAVRIAQLVCDPAVGPAHAMPSAEVTLARFWMGAARGYLAGFVGAEEMGACVR